MWGDKETKKASMNRLEKYYNFTTLGIIMDEFKSCYMFFDIGPEFKNVRDLFIKYSKESNFSSCSTINRDYCYRSCFSHYIHYYKEELTPSEAGEVLAKVLNRRYNKLVKENKII